MHVCSPRRLASPHRCEGELVNDRVCYQQVGNPSRMVWFLTPYWYVGKRDEKALGQGWVQVRTPRSSARATPLSMQVLTTAPFPHCPTGALARSSARAHQWRLVGVELGRAKMGRGARPAHCT